MKDKVKIPANNKRKIERQKKAEKLGLLKEERKEYKLPQNTAKKLNRGQTVIVKEVQDEDRKHLKNQVAGLEKSKTPGIVDKIINLINP